IFRKPGRKPLQEEREAQWADERRTDPEGEMGPSGETALPGNVSEVVQVGGTIRRSTGPWSPAVHAVLRHLEEAGFDGAPRFRGIDGQGREILTRLEGYAPPESDLP